MRQKLKVQASERKHEFELMGHDHKSHRLLHNDCLSLSLASGLDSLGPATDVLVGLLASSAGGFGHGSGFGQMCLGQAANCLLLSFRAAVV